jgi:pyruvate dehydrogenase E2 component (dihydrolipoamide acetyltransferase)
MALVKLSSWLKREGDKVSKGEPIAEVETDKTNVELEAPESGVLQTIHVKAGGDPIKPGTLLATIGAADGVTAQAMPAVGVTAQKTPTTEPAKAPPAPAEKARLAGNEPAAPVPAPTAPVHALAPDQQDTRVLASALAARMAKVAGIELTSIPGAAGRRIMKSDVEAALRQQGRGNGAGVAEASAPAEPAFEDKPLTAMRRVTAQRLQVAKQTVPHFYLEADCQADSLLDLRKQINDSGSGVKVTVTDLIVLAATLALKRVPAANSAWMESGVRQFHHIDIAIAVNTPQGLITPIVRKCESKTLGAISREIKDLSERARAGKLKPEEYTTGTFTISNLGMFGVTRITPIVNPPQACILGIGAIEPRPLVRNGQVVPGNVMGCTLAADHRAIDGATGAELLSHIRRFIEQPMSMILGI